MFARHWSIVALGNKWCKDNTMGYQDDPGVIVALGNKWCKDNTIVLLSGASQLLHLGISGARTTAHLEGKLEGVIVALGNKWCKDNRYIMSLTRSSIVALGNKWCKDNGLTPQP